MSTTLTSAELLNFLTAKATAAGFQLTVDESGMRGEVQSIRAKWLLGSRTVVYRMSCRLDAPSRTAYFREAVEEMTWGMPPPTVTLDWTFVKGWTRSGSRTDGSVGGGGSIDYHRVREDIEKSVNQSGWLFKLEGGRRP